MPKMCRFCKFSLKQRGFRLGPCYPPAMSKGLYVELPMKAGMERLWQLTQDPALHQRWDLRFSTIRYLPKSDDAAPQQFLYETRIGFGLAIAGEGESTGYPLEHHGRAHLRSPFLVRRPEIPHPHWRRLLEIHSTRRRHYSVFHLVRLSDPLRRCRADRRHAPLPPDDGVGNRVELRPPAAMDRVRYSTGVRSSLIHHLCRLPHRCCVCVDLAWARSEAPLPRCNRTENARRHRPRLPTGCR